MVRVSSAILVLSVALAAGALSSADAAAIRRLGAARAQGPDCGADVDQHVTVRSRVFFATCEADGPTLWMRDPDTGVRLKLHRSQPGAPGDAWPHRGPIRLTAAGDHLFFLDNDRRGQWLWSSDGTRAGTRRLVEVVRRRDFCPPGGTFPRCTDGAASADLAPFADRLLFTSSRFVARIHRDRGRLWISDGTLGGTLVLADLQTDLAGPVVADGRAFILGSDGTDHAGLWSTDGTPPGTRLILGTDELEVAAILPAAHGLFITSYEGEGRTGVYASDGTAAGTLKVTDIPVDAYEGSFAVTDDQLAYSRGSGPSAGDGASSGSIELHQRPRADGPAGGGDGGSASTEEGSEDGDARVPPPPGFRSFVAR